MRLQSVRVMQVRSGQLKVNPFTSLWSNSLPLEEAEADLISTVHGETKVGHEVLLVNRRGSLNEGVDHDMLPLPLPSLVEHVGIGGKHPTHLEICTLNPKHLGGQVHTAIHLRGVRGGRGRRGGDLDGGTLKITTKNKELSLGLSGPSCGPPRA